MLQRVCMNVCKLFLHNTSISTNYNLEDVAKRNSCFRWGRDVHRVSVYSVICVHPPLPLGNSPQHQLQHQRAKQLFHLLLFPLWHFTKSDGAGAVQSLLWPQPFESRPPGSSWELLSLLLWGGNLLWHTLWNIYQPEVSKPNAPHRRLLKGFIGLCSKNAFPQGIWL